MSWIPYWSAVRYLNPGETSFMPSSFFGWGRRCCHCDRLSTKKPLHRFFPGLGQQQKASTWHHWDNTDNPSLKPQQTINQSTRFSRGAATVVVATRLQKSLRVLHAVQPGAREELKTPDLQETKMLLEIWLCSIGHLAWTPTTYRQFDWPTQSMHQHQSHGWLEFFRGFHSWAQVGEGRNTCAIHKPKKGNAW